MRYLILVIVTTLMFFSLGKKETTIQALKPQDSILAFGDSLTYGYGANHTESYPFVLSSLSHRNVINAGIPAETSKEGLKRLPKLLENTSVKLMILCFGGNDIIQRRSMTSLQNNLKTMIRMAKEKKIDVLLISVPNLSLFGLYPLALYEEVAKEENVPLLTGLLADILSDPSLKSDQIHPNVLGYKQMGEKIYARLKDEGFLKR